MLGMTRREMLAAAGLGAVGLATGGWAGPARAEASAWKDLSRRMRGRLVRPGSPRYAELATPRNLRFAALMPRAVALCADARDVSVAVRWARKTGTPFAIRGGGHNYASASSSDGLIICTRSMASASVDGHRLRAQAGVRNMDLAALLPRGGRGRLLLPGGNCPNVGIVGLTLGGGIGPNAPWAGLTADHLREATMVTAEGDIVTASTRHNADLFWGLRGGAGGNFGIVTDLVYDLVELPVARATTFLLWFDGTDAAADAGVAWQESRRAGGRAISGSWVATSTADGVRGRVRGQALMTEDDARSVLEPLLALQPTSVEIVERTFWETYAWYTAPITDPSFFWDRSLYVERDLPSDAVGDITDVVSRFPRPGSAGGACQVLGWVGGAVNDVSPTATSYVHRGARSIVEVLSGWPGGENSTRWPTRVPGDIRDWVDELWAAVWPHSNGHSYQNFPDPGLQQWAWAYYGKNLERLTHVKATWDPGDIFTHAQGIPLPGK